MNPHLQKENEVLLTGQFLKQGRVFCAEADTLPGVRLVGYHINVAYNHGALRWGKKTCSEQNDRH